MFAVNNSVEIAEGEQLSTNINFITSWHNCIFDYKLRTIEAENP